MRDMERIRHRLARAARAVRPPAIGPRSAWRTVSAFAALSAFSPFPAFLSSLPRLPLLPLCAGLMISTAAGAEPSPAPPALTPLATELQMRSLAATCAACHGTDGRTTADDALPRLAGRPAEEVARLLQAFKTGALPGTVMPQLAKGYDDRQIDQLARYFAAQPAGAGTRPASGKRPAAKPTVARSRAAAGGTP